MIPPKCLEGGYGIFFQHSVQYQVIGDFRSTRVVLVERLFYTLHRPIINIQLKTPVSVVYTKSQVSKVSVNERRHFPSAEPQMFLVELSEEELIKYPWVLRRRTMSCFIITHVPLSLSLMASRPLAPCKRCSRRCQSPGRKSEADPWVGHLVST